MANTPFTDLYEAIRAATGNDDPFVGAEVMPDSRIDVLIRTAVPQLQVYSRSFEMVGSQQNEVDGTWELYPKTEGSTELLEVTKTAIALVAAHRFYVGLGNKEAASELYIMISDLAVIASGEPVIGYQAPGVQPERFQVI